VDKNLQYQIENKEEPDQKTTLTFFIIFGLIILVDRIIFNIESIVEGQLMRCIASVLRVNTF
jgi:hypothetical protein